MLKDKHVLYNKSREDILNILKGKVFETNISEEDMQEFSEHNFILVQRQEADGIVVRFVCDGEVKKEYIEVKPNLEDVFLYTYKEEEEDDNYKK